MGKVVTKKLKYFNAVTTVTTVTTCFIQYT